MGVGFAVSADAHGAERLGHTPWGMATARRGWAAPDETLNACPLEEMWAWLKLKRGLRECRPSRSAGACGPRGRLSARIRRVSTRGNSDLTSRMAVSIAEQDSPRVAAANEVAARRVDLPGSSLPSSFFSRPTADVARDLLGKILVSATGGVLTGGPIVETEAYLGRDDPGSHAATRGITTRNRVMYGPPGVAYVYFTYGMHHMLNLVTELDGLAGAVLIRAIEPALGIDAMTARRRGASLASLADGPAKVASALGVDLSDNGVPLDAGRLTVLDAPSPVVPVRTSGRIGLARGHELLLRFYLEGHPHVSRGRTGARPPKRVRGRQASTDNSPQASGSDRRAEKGSS